MKIKVDDVLGYVYDPAAAGAPYIGLILCPDTKPIISLHQSRDAMGPRQPSNSDDGGTRPAPDRSDATASTAAGGVG